MPITYIYLVYIKLIVVTPTMDFERIKANW